MAANDQSGFTYLFTSDDGGRRWHDVTPPVVVAADKAYLYDSSHNREFENTPSGRIEEAATVQAVTPFVLNSRDAWLPVLRLYGPDDQSSDLSVYMTSDAGRRWALRGRFPGAAPGGIFFLSPSTGFIETEKGDVAGATKPEPLAQIYATSDGGKHWREVSVMGLCEAISGVSFATPRLGFISGYCGWGPASLARTTDGAGKWEGHVIVPDNGEGAATYPPVFSSPEVGSMVVEVVPVVLVAITTDAGRHWKLRHLPPPAEPLVSADGTMPTWLRGPGLGPDLAGRGGPRTVHDHRRGALLEGVAVAHGPYQPAARWLPAALFPKQPAARFPGPEGGLGILGRMVGRYGPPMAYDRRRAALVLVFFGRPLSQRLGRTTTDRGLIGAFPLARPASGNR